MRTTRFIILSTLFATLLLAPSAARADDTLIGSWKIETSTTAGEADTEEIGEIITLTADAVIPPGAPEGLTIAYEVDSTATPKTIDIMIPIPDAPRGLGIYKIEDNILTICIDFPMSPEAETERPTEFSSTVENGFDLQTLSRVEE